MFKKYFQTQKTKEKKKCDCSSTQLLILCDTSEMLANKNQVLYELSWERDVILQTILPRELRLSKKKIEQ